MENELTLEQRIEKIEQRNKRVENDKAWERNPLRICLILVLTYGFAVGYLFLADTTNPFFGAMVPTVGFLLSTLSLKLIKKLWVKRRGSEGFFHLPHVLSTRSI